MPARGLPKDRRTEIRPGAIPLGGQVENLAVSSDGRLLAWSVSVAPDPYHDTVEVCDLETGATRRIYQDPREWSVAHSLAFIPQQPAICLSVDNDVKLAWLESGKVDRLATIDEGDAHAVAVSPNGKLLAVGVQSWDEKTGRVELFDLMIADDSSAATNRRMALGDQRRFVNAVAFLPNGPLLASGGDDGTVRIGDAATGQLQKTLDLREFGVKKPRVRIAAEIKPSFNPIFRNLLYSQTASAKMVR